MTRGYRSPAAVLSLIGTVAMALLAWRAGTRLWHVGLTAMYRPAPVLMLLSHAVGLALFACAVRGRRAERWRGFLSLAAVACCLSSHLYVDATLEREAETFLSTDVHVYMDYAARVTLHGKNPYETSMLAAFNDYRLSILDSTGLFDGDIPDRVAYPALSFLLFVPFIVLHVPTQFVCYVLFLLALAVIARVAPKGARALAVAPFLLEDNYLAIAAAGVIDVAWCLFLALAALSWRRALVSAIFVGLACAHKQHAWMVVPFLLAVRWNEDRGPLLARAKRLAAWAGAIAAVFLVFNGPFLLLAPSAWAEGVLDPVKTPMITWGSGLSSLTLAGVADVSPRTYLYLFALAYVVALFAVVRLPKLAPLAWIAPGFAFFFNHRSLTSYWYFYAIPFVVAALGPRSRAETLDDERSAWPVLGATAAAAIAGLVLWIVDARRPSALAVHITEPLAADGLAVYRLKLHVTNTSPREVTPRISVYANGVRPFVWPIRSGRERLGAGESDDYEVETPYPVTVIDIARGAKIFVYDRDAPAERGVARLEPEANIRRADVLANGDYRLWGHIAEIPMFWNVLARGTAGPKLTFVDRSVVVHVPAETMPERLLPERQCGDDLLRWKGGPRQFVALEQRALLPSLPIEVTAWRPAQATAPSLDGYLYGVRVVTDHRRHALVLFGDAARDGTLEDGTRYRMIAAPTGVPSVHRIDLARTLRELGVELVPTRQAFPRGPYLDIAGSMIRIQLFAAGGVALGDFRFGGVQSAAPPYPEPRSDEERRWDEAWHAQRNSELGNHEKARREIGDAPATARLRGDIEARAGQGDEAMRSYDVALAQGDDPALVGTGKGWAHYGRGEYAAARDELIRALQVFEGRSLPCDDEAYAYALRGLASALAHLGDCDGSRDARAQMKRQVPLMRVDADVLAACPD